MERGAWYAVGRLKLGLMLSTLMRWTLPTVTRSDGVVGRMRQAVLSIEDQSFYSHPGINPIRLIAAAIRNASGRDEAVVGYSTITQMS